jgi:hypothetical protein
VHVVVLQEEHRAWVLVMFDRGIKLLQFLLLQYVLSGHGVPNSTSAILHLAISCWDIFASTTSNGIGILQHLGGNSDSVFTELAKSLLRHSKQ